MAILKRNSFYFEYRKVETMSVEPETRNISSVVSSI